MSVQNFLTDEGSKELHGVRSGNAARNRGGSLLFPAVLRRSFLPGSLHREGCFHVLGFWIVVHPGLQRSDRGHHVPVSTWEGCRATL